ncbi:unnamed protein product [Cladocopium goreaui]|uniref:C3H1-type domain-containing protein n=1 Tax=Cladocopium goreaui TaxID=2562237 RepID=A0A9P1FUD3_9DINO|nr:unnamed protein product [Cladocopium goreaui]
MTALQVPQSKVDFLIPSMEPDGTFQELEPLNYAETTRIFREMLLTPWKKFQDQHPLAHLQQTYTLHSMKATLLSFGPQLGNLVSDSDRLLQGHHQDPKHSLNLYGRDSVWGSLRYQSTIIMEIHKGWRPKTAQHRGGQFPLTEPTVTLERFQKTAPDYSFQWLPFSKPEDPHEILPEPEVEQLDSDNDSSSISSQGDSSSSEALEPMAHTTTVVPDEGQVDEAVFARHRKVTHAMVATTDDTESSWTVQSFAFSALDLEAFDKLWPEFFSDEPTLLQKASLRAAFRMCHDLTQPAPANQTPVGGTATSDASASASTWAESFPPKLDTAVIEQMKAKFLASYPSELLNHDTMPSTRLLSLTHHQLSKKQWSWIPWKYRLTLAKSDEITSQRQAKMPKLEVATLHSLLVDEPPSIDISNAGFGVNAVRNLLAVHDTAVAMCGGAHLANLKAYSAKFLSFLTQRVDPDTMLRCASITEAQAADRPSSTSPSSSEGSIHDINTQLLKLYERTPKESTLEEQPTDARLFLDICSGATRPLSAAILAQQGNVLSFDILLDKRMDLLNDQSYEQLLRICSSGQALKHFEHLKL